MIVDAWVRVRERPGDKLSCGVAFDEFAAGAEAVREISQSGLNPSNCRLLDAVESETTSAGPPGKALLVLGFESAHHPVDEPMAIAIEVARAHGGEPGEIKGQAAEEPGPGSRRGAPAPAEPGEDPVNAWRHAFLFAPYLRDSLVACGVLSDTFETAITWDRFPDFHAEVMETARRAVAEGVAARPPRAAARRGSAAASPTSTRTGRRPTTRCSPRRGGADEVAQWDEIKAAVSDAVIDAGGTITHHHAVGRDHRPWYDRQRPEPFADALRAAKARARPEGDPQSGRPDRSPTGRIAADHRVSALWPYPLPVHGRPPDQGAGRAGGGASQPPTARSSKPRRGPARAAIVAMRPQEWVKNLLVFAGLLFSAKFDEFDAIVDATITFAAFCMVASAGYLINDAHDVELDRQHPTKRRRPIAAGELGIPHRDRARRRAGRRRPRRLATVARAGWSAAWSSPTESARPSTPTCSSTR